MLRKILLTGICFMVALHLEAQKKFIPSTYVGIDGGMGMCWVGFNPTIKQNMLFTQFAGLFFRHVSEPHIGIQIEVNEAGRGWIENRDSLGTYKRERQVIDLPLTAVFIAGHKTVRFAFTIGPYVSYRLKDKEMNSVRDTAYYREYYNRQPDDRWEFGGTAGLALEWYTGIGDFALRATYSHSLTNVFPLSSPAFYYDSSRSQAVQVGLVYFIRL
jgi:hypothetical protein